MRRRTVLSLEQATALPHATQRFRQLGWRVIRIEATAAPDDPRPGDPNRYAGRIFADEGRRSAFAPLNVGKEAVALNLKTEAGRALMAEMIEALGVDVFCCNVLPKSYAPLGIDYERLSAQRPRLVWAGISAMGPEHPAVGGYDPVIQAMSGLMSVTGFEDGPPMMHGAPITDLKAADELYAGVMAALLDLEETGRGARIDVSMFQAAASWLSTLLPLVDMGAPPQDWARSGNAHRVFVPTGVYETVDGFLYVAVGNARQWRALCAADGFSGLGRDGAWDSLEARMAEREAVTAALAAPMRRLTTAAAAATLAEAGVPHSVVNDVAAVHAHPAIRGRMPATVAPDGRRVRLAPPGVGRGASEDAVPFAPRYGEHTDSVLAEIGLGAERRERLRRDGVIA